MSHEVTSTVLKSKNALMEAHVFKEEMDEIKKECADDIEMMDENSENYSNSENHNEVTTSISEMNELQQEVPGTLQPNNTASDYYIPPKTRRNTPKVVWKDVQSAFENRIQIGVIMNRKHIDPKSFLDDSESMLRAQVSHLFKSITSLKINTVLCCEFKLTTNKEQQFELKYFDTQSVSLYKYDNFETWYLHNVEKPLLNSFEEFQANENGWALSAVVDLKININKYTMLMGSSYVDLPKEIKAKKACVNVRNDDEACFAWAVVSALYPIRSGSDRMKNYPRPERVLKLQSIQFPMTINQIPHFERQNKLSINVFSLKLNKGKTGNEKYTVVPEYISRDTKDQHVNLMLIQNRYDSDEDSSTGCDDDRDVRTYHYVWVKQLSRLLSSQLSGNSSQKHICNRCLHYFTAARELTNHMKDCSANNIKISLPNENFRNLEFRNCMRKKKAPFVIYAGLECLSNETSVKRYNNRTPANIGYYVKCSYDPTLSFYKSYRGVDCISWFASELQQFAEDVSTVFMCEHPRSELSPSQRKEFESPFLCYVCEKPFTETCRKVPNHCRFTGAYKGTAHDICSMNYSEHRAIPVFFHNLRDFDSQLLLNHFKSSFDGRIHINAVGNNESFITFTKHTYGLIKFRFIDSSQFLGECLASFQSTFPVLRSEMSSLTEEQFRLLTKKTVYPDRYVDSPTKYYKTVLPSKLSFGGVSLVEYEHAKNVWDEFRLKNLGEYSDLCLKSNILRLADAFETFRNTCIENYKLEPSFYYSLQSYSWDAMLKQANVSLKLLTNMDMVSFIERGTRGGLSQCSKRYSRANNMHLRGYIDTKRSKYLMHFCVNDQWSWAMSQYQPYGNFQWVEDFSYFDVQSVPDDSLTGYLLEVDLEYPREIHDLHKDLPFCPEYRKTPNSKPQGKLVATLYNKSNYVIHYRNLKQALNHGLILTKIHRVLQFDQSPWLKSFIDLNHSLSISAENDFDRNIFERLNYSVYEKFIENIRTESTWKFVTKWEGRYGVEARISKSEFKALKIIDENLAIIELKPSEIFLSEPIYVGMCVQELAKLRLYEFHYGYMQQKFSQYSTVCYIDNDSILYEITSIDIYDSIKEDCGEHFDTSEYQEDNLWNIPRINCKALGLIKDRNNGRVISEFVGIKSKMYEVIMDDRDKPKPIVGIDQEIGASRVTFEDYADCLLNETGSLSLLDDKRYLMEDGCKTLPWGHYSLQM